MKIRFFYWCLTAAVSILIVTVESATRQLPPLTSRESFTLALEQPNIRGKIKEVSLNYRLPNETYPEYYEVKLTTSVHLGEEAFQGEVTIAIVVATKTNTVVVHARQLEISGASISSLLTGEKEEVSWQYEEDREFLTFRRKNGKPFEADTKWKLAITYSGSLRDDNKGFYISTYIDDKGRNRYLATTQFESTDARHAFPCYDEPDKRANFTITIIHDPTYKAISNMPVNSALSSSGKTVFLQTARIPTYIVAFLVSDFESSGGTLNDLPHQVFSRANAKHAHEWAVVSSMLITQRLSEYYGVDFMLPKLDHVAVPDFAAGAMENWGLVTYREEYLLYNEQNSTVFTQTDVANTIAHEVAHHWFGNFVAIKWWTYLWLKEGFATLFSYRALADAYPEWDIWQGFHVSDYQGALNRDGSDSPRPMTHYVEKPQDISKLYDSVSYGKAGSVLHMWNHALTDKVFQQGLHNYLTVSQYSNAVEQHLFTALQNAAKEENYRIPAQINEMMGSWSRQGGYPLLTITRNYDDGSFTITQAAFHDDETLQDKKTWFVPINFAVASKSDFRDTEATYYLLNVTEMKINAEIKRGDWLMLNKQSAYYYRIKYDEENYKLIIDSLIERPFKIHVRNRAQLMHDAFRLSVSKRLDHSILLRMMTYLKKEDQYAPWSTANGIFSSLNKYFKADPRYKEFKTFIADQVVPIYEKLGVNDLAGEQHYQKYTRNVVINLACLAGVEDCLNETREKLKALVYNNTEIEPNLRRPIYCNGLRKSGDEEFNFVFKQLMDSTDQAFRRLLIVSLGCSENERHIKKLIYSSIDKTNNLRTQERATLLNPVYSNSEVGLLACIEFLNEHWNDYGNLSGGFTNTNPLDSDMRKMANYVINESVEKKYLSLLAKVKDSEHVESNLENDVKETIADNNDWLNDNREPLMNWITRYHSEKAGDGSACLAASAVLIVVAIFTTNIFI